MNARRPVSPAVLSLAAALISGAAARALDAAHDAAAYFPLAAGNAWTYEGTAHVPNTGVYEFFDVPVTLTMTATDEKRWGDVRLFVMEGHPDDASWTLDGATVDTGLTVAPSRYGLLCVGNKMFRVAGDDLEEVMVTAGAGGEADVPFIAGGGPALEVPLFVGARFGDYTRLTRADRNYFWYCADAAPYKGGKTAYHLVFRSTTDQTDLWLVPGVGITRYEYVITGTPLVIKLALSDAALK